MGGKYKVTHKMNFHQEVLHVCLIKFLFSELITTLMFTLFWCVTPCSLAGTHHVSGSLRMEATNCCNTEFSRRLQDFVLCNLETVGVILSILGPNPQCLAVKDSPYIIAALLALLLPDNRYLK